MCAPIITSQLRPRYIACFTLISAAEQPQLCKSISDRLKVPQMPFRDVIVACARSADGAIAQCTTAEKQKQPGSNRATVVIKGRPGIRSHMHACKALSS